MMKTGSWFVIFMLHLGLVASRHHELGATVGSGQVNSRVHPIMRMGKGDRGDGHIWDCSVPCTLDKT